MIIFFLFVSFCLLFTLEKASFFYFLLSLYIVLGVSRFNGLKNDNSFSGLISGRLVGLLVIFAAGLSLIYHFFMNGSIIDAFSRMARQTASNYIQINYIKNYGYIGLDGLNSNILQAFGAQKESVNFSELAIIDLYPTLHDSGLTGAAGGMFSTNLFFMFGWAGLVVAFVYVIALGIFDRIFCNSAFSEKNTRVSYILISFYAFFCSWYAMRAFSSPLAVFSVDYIFNPALLIFLAFLSIFVHPSLRRF